MKIKKKEYGCDREKKNWIDPLPPIVENIYVNNGK